MVNANSKLKINANISNDILLAGDEALAFAFNKDSERLEKIKKSKLGL